MTQVKVYNDNHLPYKEEFEDEMIVIKPNSFIIMDEEKAVMFKGRYRQIERDGGGVQKPESFKKIRIAYFQAGEEKKVNELRCQACSFVANSKDELDAHINEDHLEQLLDKDEYKKRKAKQ